MALEAVVVAQIVEDEQIPAQVFRAVERELYDYPFKREYLRDYLERQDEIIRRMRQWPDNDGSRPGGCPGDPTYTAAVELIGERSRAERYAASVRAIESVMQLLSDEERTFVRRKYWDNDVTNECLARELHMSKQRYYRMRAEVIRKFALRLGWI